jgi:hypothetical protein
LSSSHGHRWVIGVGRRRLLFLSSRGQPLVRHLIFLLLVVVMMVWNMFHDDDDEENNNDDIKQVVLLLSSSVVVIRLLPLVLLLMEFMWLIVGFVGVVFFVVGVDDDA